MKKITEDRCSLEICILLKERGFNEDTDYIFYYYEEDDDWCFKKLLPDDKFDKDKMLHCPTHQMALKWLREKHKIGIFPTIYEHTINESKIHNYGVTIVNLEDFCLLDTDYFYSDTYDGTVDFSISYILQKFIKTL